MLCEDESTDGVFSKESVIEIAVFRAAFSPDGRVDVVISDCCGSTVRLRGDVCMMFHSSVVSVLGFEKYR